MKNEAIAPSVPQEILDRIDLLAEKLGVAASGLWEILVAQSKVEAIISIALGAVALIISGALTWLAVSLIRKACDDLDFGVPAVVVCVLDIIAFGFVIQMSVEATRYLLNPEWMALRLLLGQF